jgi:hypothetical protein
VTGNWKYIFLSNGTRYLEIPTARCGFLGFALAEEQDADNVPLQGQTRKVYLAAGIFKILFHCLTMDLTNTLH